MSAVRSGDVPPSTKGCPRAPPARPPFLAVAGHGSSPACPPACFSRSGWCPFASAPILGAQRWLVRVAEVPIVGHAVSWPTRVLTSECATGSSRGVLSCTLLFCCVVSQRVCGVPTCACASAREAERGAWLFGVHYDGLYARCRGLHLFRAIVCPSCTCQCGGGCRPTF